MLTTRGKEGSGCERSLGGIAVDFSALAIDSAGKLTAGGYGLLDTLETTGRCFLGKGKQAKTDEKRDKFRDRKRQSVALSKRFRRVGLIKEADQLAKCCEIGKRSSCIDCGTVKKYYDFWQCKHRLCPVCAHARSVKNAERISRFLASYIPKNGLYSYFLTLTFRNTEELPDIKALNACRKKLFASKLMKEMGFVGGISALEVKTGKNSGQWHAHFHCLALSTKPIELIEVGEYKGYFQNAVNQRIAEQWQKITGDSFVVRGRNYEISDIREIVKYISKTSEFNDVQLKEFAEWSKGKRFITCYGVLYANAELSKGIDADDVDDDADDVPVDECVCAHCGGKNIIIEEIIYDHSLKDFLTLDIYRPGERKKNDDGA